MFRALILLQFFNDAFSNLRHVITEIQIRVAMCSHKQAASVMHVDVLYYKNVAFSHVLRHLLVKVQLVNWIAATN